MTWWFAGCGTCRRRRSSCCEVTAVLGGAVSLRDVASVARRSPTEVVAQLSAAFGAQLLDEAGDRVVFRHQLVHDAIYRHVPRRLAVSCTVRRPSR